MRYPVREWAGIVRSLAIYYGNPWRLHQMAGFYRQFIRPGDLCFDIGSHVGNRVFVWSRLSARVVAVEPQAQLVDILQRLYGRRPGVIIRAVAVADRPGHATLYADPRNPTVSTLSREWAAEVQRDASFTRLDWSAAGTVPTTTLDALIATYGRPAFCKIDVEGHELAVLEGLSQPLPALSFEFLPVTATRAVACIERLEQLGEYEFNWFRRETHRWELTSWQSSTRMIDILQEAAIRPDSGDVFGRLRSVAGDE